MSRYVTTTYVQPLRTLFVPHRKNSFRPPAARHTTAGMYAVLLIIAQLYFGIYNIGPEVKGAAVSVLDQEVVDATNKARADASLGKLSVHESLKRAAQKKAADMFIAGYFDHTSPRGERAWEFMRQEGYNYTLAGENLARGFVNGEDTVEAWLESPAHRENLLNPLYTDIGVAVQSGTLSGQPTTVVVELLGSERAVPATADSRRRELFSVSGATKAIVNPGSLVSARWPLFLMGGAILGLLIIDGVMLRRLEAHHAHAHTFGGAALLAFIAVGLLFMHFGQIL